MYFLGGAWVFFEHLMTSICNPTHRIQFIFLPICRTTVITKYWINIHLVYYQLYGQMSSNFKFWEKIIFNRRNHLFWVSENPLIRKEAGFQEKLYVKVFCLLMNNQMWYVINIPYNILRTIVEPFLKKLSNGVIGISWLRRLANWKAQHFFFLGYLNEHNFQYASRYQRKVGTANKSSFSSYRS